MAETFPSLSWVRGDTPSWSDKLFDDAGYPLDLAGVSVWLTAKPAPDDDATDASAVLKHEIAIAADGTVTSAHGITVGGIDPDPASPTYEQAVTGVTSGVLTHLVSAEDSTAIPPGSYVYDVQVRNAAGRIKTIVEQAPLIVRPDVTRRTTVGGG